MCYHFSLLFGSNIHCMIFKPQCPLLFRDCIEEKDMFGWIYRGVLHWLLPGFFPWPVVIFMYTEMCSFQTEQLGFEQFRCITFLSAPT